MRTRDLELHMVLVRAPLRLPLGGGGTDLPAFYSIHGGRVISAAIDKYVYVLVRRDPLVAGIRSRLIAQGEQEVNSYEEIENPLLRATLQALPFRIKNIEIASLSDVPPGTGLGSSGSFVVALLKALHVFHGNIVDRRRLAEQAFKIEVDFAGRPVGKQDHYISTFGGLRVLTISRNGKVQIESIDIPLSRLRALNRSIALFYDGKTRDSSIILSRLKDGAQRGQTDILANLKTIKDIGSQIIQSINKGDIDEFGLLLRQHWDAKRRLLPDVSYPEMDKWYSLARRRGALGGKIVGSGGGGFLLFCCPEKSQVELRKVLVERGLIPFKYSFDLEGVRVVSVTREG